MAGIKIVGPQKKFRYTFMILLTLFYFTNFSSCQLKNGALGNLGKVRLPVLTLTDGIKLFGPQKKFRYTFMTLLKLFIF